MKHPQIVEDLRKRQLAKNRIVYTNLEYIIASCPGEADNLGISIVNNYALCIEVKGKDSEKNRAKAIKQTYKDEQYIIENYPITRIHKFYAYTDSSMPRGYNVELVK